MTQIKKVFLIDDDELYIFLLKMIIESTRLVDQIQIFENGQDALEFIQNNVENDECLPEIIFLDIAMPVLDGWGFLEEYPLLKPHLKKRIELFILSSSVSPHDLERAQKNIFVSDFIIKPMTKQRFISIIEQI